MQSTSLHASQPDPASRRAKMIIARDLREELVPQRLDVHVAASEMSPAVDYTLPERLSRICISM